MYLLFTFFLTIFSVISGDDSVSSNYPRASRLGGRPLPHQGQFEAGTLFECIKAQQDLEVFEDTAIAYGFTERIWSTLWIPFFLENNIEGERSRGISDIFWGGAYTYFLDEPNRAHGQVAIKFPTGNPNKHPATGTGTYDIFLQHTTIHSSENWFASADIEGFIRLKNKKYKPGNTFDTELIFGHAFHPARNWTIYTSGDIFMIYNQGNDTGTLIDADSGGTVIFLGPLISVFYKSIFFEFIFQVPIGQNLFGNQPRIDFLTYFVCAISF